MTTLNLDRDLPTADAHHLIDNAIEHHLSSIEQDLASLVQIEEAIKRHRASIQSHKASLLALKSQRNTFAPIGLLPPEILCNIFSRARDYDSKDLIENEEGFLVLNSLTWINITYVCRHWRTVAINSSSLWTHPPLRNIKWLEEMIKRSKEADLFINYDDGWDDHKTRLELFTGLNIALKRSWRIRHLSIRTKAWNWQKYGLALCLPSSHMSSICLSSSYVSPQLEAPAHDPGHDHGAKPLFQFGFSSSDLPNLRHLELNYFQVKWDTQSPFLRGLTHLKLHGTTPRPGLTWPWLLDTLRAIQHLEVLDLKDSFPAYTEQDTDYIHTFAFVHFNCLQNLSLCCDPKEGVIFLSCISFPPTTSVKLECGFNINVVSPVPSIDFAGILISLAHIYSNMASQPNFQTLVLLRAPCKLPGATYKLFERALTDERIVYALQDEAPAQLEITYTWASRYGPRDDIGAKAASDVFSCGLPLQNVKHVYLMDEIYGFVGPTVLANTIGELPHVSSIVTVGVASRDLINAMQLGAEGEDQDAPVAKPCFPSLSSVSFHGTRLRPLYFYENNPGDDPDHLPIYLLCNCLAQRSMFGTRLTKLAFRYCGKLFRADIDFLNGIVEDLGWDEEEITFNSDDGHDSDVDSDEDDEEGEWEARDEVDDSEEDGDEDGDEGSAD